MDWTTTWKRVVENAAAHKIPVSEFNRGTVCGYSGAALPLHEPADSEFAIGWRHGRELHLSYGQYVESPLFGETAEIKGKQYVRGRDGQWKPKVPKETWPLTWPKGVEGAASLIPGLVRKDVARIRKEGGPTAAADAPAMTGD